MSDLTGKTCVVTGGAGFVGSHLVSALTALGAHVVVLDTNTRATHEHKNARAVVGDVTDYAVVENVLKDAHVVFHLAALTSVPGSVQNPQDYYHVNVQGTLTILECARGMTHPPRIIFASSAAVYGEQKSIPVSEELPRKPMSPYAQTKAIGEDMMLLWHSLYNLETVSLRCFNIYGSRMNPHGPYASLIGKFLLLRMTKEPLTISGDGEQTRDHIHIRDVVNAYIEAAVSSRVGGGEIINVASGNGVTVNHVAQIIGGEVVHIPERIGDIRHSVADTSRAHELLSWKPTITLHDGLTELKKEYGII